MIMIVELNINAFTGVVTMIEVETAEDVLTPEQAIQVINALLAENPYKKYSFIIYHSIKPTIV